MPLPQNLEAELECVTDGLQITTESTQKIRELLQCPVCLEIPLPPIYLCKRGHIVCNPCQDRTYFCPLCRDEYSSTRSFVAEGLVESFTMKCKFRDQGCTEVLKGADMVKHMKICGFRPARCIYCHGEYVPYSEFFQHLLTTHKIDGVVKSNGSIKYKIPMTQIIDNSSIGNVEKFYWAPSYFKCLGHTFMFHLHVANGSVCGWACLMGIESDCKSYEAIIEFEGDKFKIQWKGQVNNFRQDPITGVCKNGRGLVLPFEVVRSNSFVNHAASAIEWSYNVFFREIQLPVQSPTPHPAIEQAETSNSQESPPKHQQDSQKSEGTSAKSIELITIRDIPIALPPEPPAEENDDEEEEVDEETNDSVFHRYLYLDTPGLDELRDGLFNEFDEVSEF